MFTTGFKYWFAVGTAALLGAFVYAVSTSDAGLMDTIVGPITLGYKGAVGEQAGFAALVGFGGLSIATALLLAAWRDADPKSVAEVARTEVAPAPRVPQAASPWPLVAAFAAAFIALGVVVGSALTVIGLGLLVVAGLEWTISAWSERATVEPASNMALRTKLFFPIELPIIAAVTIGVFVLAGSRILLAVDATAAVAIAGVLATTIFLGAIALAARPELGKSLVSAVLIVGAVGLLAGGVIAAAAGERDFEHHEVEHPADDGGESDSHDEAPADAHDDEALVVLP